MTTIKRIRTELNTMITKPIENITAGPISETDLYNWRATICGPPDTPYENGIFHLNITFGNDYPYKAPHIAFITKIYHPNIDSHGSICLDILKRDAWSPVLNIQKVLLSISSLIAEPNPDDPYVSSIAKIYKEDRELYNKNVREYTLEHASKKS